MFGINSEEINSAAQAVKALANGLSANGLTITLTGAKGTIGATPFDIERATIVVKETGK